ncbi:N-formylglutamate amidohydrolase [Cognatishimia maritima]|uniref:Predicted N-formylglutamate amidohydrolase n=1 Tax=Cognatishimia maritima TaxID=870908 RepID=A0A1M5QRU8_9RHOB|nr:N-formylglutamate amidohydrolase [Cognatishimia maritima]SHH16479.1 Predicted N-formylglutamate amidohydrolase [Cognatishimia maritima]
MDDTSVIVLNGSGASNIVLVCEHASQHIPARYGGLGLSEEAANSHAAWDPGAYGVARDLSDILDAPLVASTVSRLVYDCNRPPESDSAIREVSEIHDIPGNHNLTPEQRAERVDSVYRPFETALSDLMDQRQTGVLVTVHSFTPVFHGKPREVQLGILHDDDTSLADKMLVKAATHTALKTARNEPYGPEDGVTHTLKQHALPRGWANVMLEFRNDMIATPQQQHLVANDTAALILDALDALALTNRMETGQCRV